MTEEFQRRIAGFTQHFVHLWHATKASPLCLERTIAPAEKLRIEGKAQAAAARFEQLLMRFPKAMGPRAGWRQELLASMKQMARDCLLLPERGLDLFFTEPAMEATRRFVTQGHEFDPGIRDEHLFQALRNVWVVNFLQLLLGRQPSLGRAAFGYSMLYPCTDNFLDDPAVPAKAKNEFGMWLELRLKEAATEQPRDMHARQVDHLVRLIELEYPRTIFPEIYWCLAAIHQAQMGSLRQHEPLSCPNEETLLGLTFTKGGTSVLSDAYLVSGRPTQAQAEFAYGYGIALQLMDDLQDVETDRENGHSTLFTRGLAQGTLDGLTRRLWHFLHAVLERLETIAVPKVRCVRDLIQENCSVLLIQSVVANPGCFSPAFIAEVEVSSPFRLEFARSQKQRLTTEFHTVVSYLRRRRRVRSLLDLLK